ncbi:MAG: hypothetical protein EAY81_09415 [Bacteroidetes bacterium]|nr:MAG: hypothetical protein EAY81_09415 [Bacteroidota bacterium]TAF43108.1 MAG: hypothetical protein EAZ64_09555 [Sphingobacteriales bacterium]
MELKFKKELIAEAVKCEICKPFESKLAEAKSVGELLAMYIAGIDFCLEKNFPSNDFLIKNAGEELVNFGIHIDKEIDLTNPQKAVLLGKTNANLNYNEFETGEVFVKHNSKANINVGGNAYLVIDCFDNTETSVIAYGDAKVLLNIYKGAKVTTACVNHAVISEVKKNKISY